MQGIFYLETQDLVSLFWMSDTTLMVVPVDMETGGSRQEAGGRTLPPRPSGSPAKDTKFTKDIQG